MATTFRNTVVKEIGITPTQVCQTTEISKATVIGLSLTNLTSGNVTVNVLLEDDTSTQGYYVKGVIIPAGNSLRVVNQGEKLILSSNNQLIISTDTANSIDAIVSWVEIT